MRLGKGKTDEEENKAYLTYVRWHSHFHFHSWMVFHPLRLLKSEML